MLIWIQNQGKEMSFWLRNDIGYYYNLDWYVSIYIECSQDSVTQENIYKVMGITRQSYAICFQKFANRESAQEFLDGIFPQTRVIRCDA